MSETQRQILDRMIAEAVEARQHKCERCGHDGNKHAFDFVATNDPNPCKFSCMVCMGINNDTISK